MSDATILFRDIAGDTAQKAASKVNPSDEQLQQIDAPAEDNTWHEAPDLSKQNIKSQIQSQLPVGKKDVRISTCRRTSRGFATLADLIHRPRTLPARLLAMPHRARTQTARETLLMLLRVLPTSVRKPARPAWTPRAVPRPVLPP